MRTIRNGAWSATIVAIAFGCFSASASALDRVRTYSQPTFTGFPTYVADKMGFFEKHGIDASPKMMASGAPILQAAAAGEVDMAFLGAPPAVIGGANLGLMIVGVVVEEAPYHQLIGRPDYVAKVKSGGGAALKGAKIFVTTLSTGHFMTEACLKKLGVSQSEVSLIPSEQPATLSAFATGQGDLAQVWPPQSTVLRERGNQVLCDGEQAGVSIPSVWVASPKFLQSNPDLVARWIRAHLDAIDWMKKDFARTYDLYKKFEAYRGFGLAENALQDETRISMASMTGPTQLEFLTSRDGKPSAAKQSLTGIAEFFIRVGRLKKVPELDKLIDVRPLEAALKR